MVAKLRTIVSFLRTLWNHPAIISNLRAENSALRELVANLEKASETALTLAERASESEAPLKPLRFKRPDYATAQSDWEWQHNRRAREIMDRARDGFL